MTLLSPEPLGSLALSTALEWSSAVGRLLSVVSLRPGPAPPARPADPTAAWIRIATSGTSANLVRLEHAGIDLHSGTSYVWAVETYEAGTVDDYARLSAVGEPGSVSRPHPLASGIVARSETRQLRTP